MTEYITKEQAEKIFEQIRPNSIESYKAGCSVANATSLYEAINLAFELKKDELFNELFEQRLEVVGWHKVEDRLPDADETGFIQTNVLFCSPHWSWAVLGMYTSGIENPWSEYDQQNDKYIEWEAERPTLWMYTPKVGTQLYNLKEPS